MKYDLLVIGGGPGGTAAALTAARLGKKVLLFESRDLGGTCLNRGCIPTKALLHSAGLLRALREGAGAGVLAEGVRVDYEALRARKDEVVQTLQKGAAAQLKAAKVERVEARATVTGAHTVRAGGEAYEGEHILLATGSAPALPPVPGLDLPGVYTSDRMLEEIPRLASLVILGGGVIGVEFAALYAALGAKVTVLEAQERILPGLDRELSQSLSMSLKKDGVEVYAAAPVEEIAPGPSVAFTHKGERRTVEAELVLAAMGRKAELGGLLDGLALETEAGRLKVDEGFRTSAPSILAVGDLIAGPQLAHKAEHEGKEAVRLLYGGVAGGLAPIPACVYTSPEMAAVGITQEEASRDGISVTVGKSVMGGNGRTVIEGGRRGFVKLVFHKESRVLLGAQLLCERATDLISELTLAVTLGLTAEALGRAVRPHPTFSEAITQAVEAARFD